MIRMTGCVASLLVLLAVTGRGDAQTIDFSLAGIGPFDQNFFSADGVIFTEGTFVGFVQSDEALVFVNERVAGTFTHAVSDISVQLAPSFQGTAIYTLTALDASSSQIGNQSVQVTEDTGDPEDQGLGYFSVSLTGLPGAFGFSVESTFVRSSFSNTTTAPAMSSMSFTVILGDANGDGAVDNFDIIAFGLALFDPTMYASMYPGVDPDVVLDMNGDGSFNNLDTSGFGEALGF